MHLRVLPLLALGLLLLTCQSTPRPSGPPDVVRLKASLDALAADPVFAESWLGFQLTEVATGKPILSYNGGKAFAMASVMKLYSTAFALQVLGPDYTFKTPLHYTGTLTDTVLYGDLVVVGTGDPTFGTERWTEALPYAKVIEGYVGALKAHGIRRIVGRVRVDDTRYSANPTPTGWVWGDIGNYYGAPCYSLNVLDNQYKLRFLPTEVGDTAWVLGTDPDVRELHFRDAMHTGKAGSGDNGYIDGSPYDTLRFLSGTVPDGNEFTIRGALPYPPLFFARRLTEALALSDILCTQPPTTSFLDRTPRLPSQPFPQAPVIASPNLETLARLTNWWSVNLFAEGLLRAAAFKRDSAHTHAEAIASLQAHLKSQGIGTQGLRLGDGSGLSRMAQATPQNVVGLLVALHKSAVFPAYWGSLGVAGKDGIVRSSRLAGGNELRMKSGYFSGAASFAGYVKTTDGGLYAFCLVTNGCTRPYSSVRAKLETVLGVLSGA